MKTKVITIAMLVFVLLLGSAKTFGQQFALGAKVGVGLANYSHFDSDGGDIKRSPNTMVQGGFIMNYMFGKLLGLKVEALFQQKGEVYKYNLTSHGTTISAKTRMYFNYLTLPILIQASHSFGNFTLFGGVGPYIGYALNGKVVEIEPEKTSGKLEFGKDKFRRFDAGLCIDLGGGIKFGPGNLFLDLRYDLGFMDVSQPTTKPPDYKTHDNRNIGIALGYLIPLGR